MQKRVYPKQNYVLVQSQQGAALIVALIILLALTIIILPTARNSTLELLLGVNSQSQAEALAAAEDSMRAGEAYILARYNAAPRVLLKDAINDASFPGLYANGTTNLTTMDWSNINTFSFPNPDGVGAVEFIIEYVAQLPAGDLSGTIISTADLLVYRVSGLGQTSDGSQRIVQSYYSTFAN